MTRTRIFHAADLHGSDVTFKKMLNAAKFYGAHELILGGDVTGKVVVPFVENGDGTYRSAWHGKRRMKPALVEEEEGKLRDAGLYSCRIAPKEMEELEADPRLQYPLFNRLMKERLREWVRLADARLRPQRLKLHVIPGNDDRFEVDEDLRLSETIVYCEGDVVEVAGVELASCGYTNPTPWNTPRELPEENLKTKLDAVARKVKAPETAIFNFHCPPVDVAIDLAPKLTKDMKVVARAGTVQMDHVGSRAVREILEEYQPMLGLHGHIHESRGNDRIGQTTVLNPGSEYNQGVLHGVLVDIEDRKLVKYQFTMG